MSSRPSKLSSVQTAAALNALAHAFWAAAAAVVERRPDAEDVQKPIERVKLTRHVACRFANNVPQLTRASATPPQN